MKKIITLCMCILANLSAAPQPAIQWQKSLGGTVSDVASSICQTADGGYIVAGVSNSNDSDVTGNHGMNDYWVVKLDGTGNMQWQKSLGGTLDDWAHSVKQTTDGGYIVAGGSGSNDGDVTGNHGSSDYWIVKLDGSGYLQWQKSFGGSDGEEAYSIEQTTDGGYIVAGLSTSNDGDVTGNHGTMDYWVVKLDGAGNILWQKSLGGTNGDNAKSVQQTTDGGYIVAGFSNSANGDVTGHHGTTVYTDYWVVKLDSSGTIQWEKSLGGTLDDRAFAVEQTTDGGYIVAGYTISNDGDVTGNHGYYDYWVVKLDSAGNIQWQKALGGTNQERAYSVQQTSDGGYIVAGFSLSVDGDVTGNHGYVDDWVVKLDTAGIMQWEKSLGGTLGEYAYSARQTADGGYIVAGFSSSTDGDVTGNYGNQDYWIVKLGAVTGIEDAKENNSISIYPNPTKGKIVLTSPFGGQGTVYIYDVMGKEIFYKKDILLNQYEINTGEFEKGVYFLNVNTSENTFTKKIVKL